MWREILPFWVMSLTGIGFALFTPRWPAISRWTTTSTTSLGPSWWSARTSPRSASSGSSKFLVLNRLFAQIADAELDDEAPAEVAADGLY